ncbi:MAG TPA: nucleotidyl transferase AbiEii/AbiGii toxin family protein, partial [Acidobacteriota bacterium]|nr:nucleotidyl transferase AbiEii/AbiGii toxin family protein [Acidobacteriota bacterium]
KTVVMDRTDFLERLIAVLNQRAIRFCVVDGQAVNAYAEPVVSLDLDLAVAVEQMGQLKSELGKEFNLQSFEHSLNVSALESDLRVQIQTDPRYSAFVDRAEERTILGLRLPVARIEDVLQGKVWAVQDRTRRSSKRQKDLADISRLLEAHPALRKLVPEEILSRLF